VENKIKKRRSRNIAICRAEQLAKACACVCDPGIEVEYNHSLIGKGQMNLPAKRVHRAGRARQLDAIHTRGATSGVRPKYACLSPKGDSL